MSSMPDLMLISDNAKALNRLLLNQAAAGDSDRSTHDARIARPDAIPSDTVRVGFTVAYKELPVGTRRRVTLVIPRDADASAGRISVLSPVGCALLGRTKDQVVPVALPMGREVSVRVLEVTAPVDEVDEPLYA